MTTYDTTTSGLANAGLTEAPRHRSDLERARDAVQGEGTTTKVARAARRPAPLAAAVLVLAGAAASVVVWRRRTAARQPAWKRLLKR